MSRATVEYCGVPMDCTYYYEPEDRRTWDFPGSPANASLESCKVGGVEILNMLDNSQCEQIESLILEVHGEQDADAARERQWERQEEMLAERGYP